MGRFAVIGVELANRLLSKGFELVEIKQGKFTMVFYFIDTEELAMVGGSNEIMVTMGLTKVAALAFLMFNLFTPPCFAALGAMNAEMANAKWFWGGVALQFATGYTIAFVVYQVGTLITTGALGAGFIGGLIAVICFVAIMVFVAKKNNAVAK